MLKLDFEMAIPGRGEPKTRDEVQAFRKNFAMLIGRATDAIKAGATKDLLVMQVKTDDLGWQFNPQFFAPAIQGVETGVGGHLKWTLERISDTPVS